MKVRPFQWEVCTAFPSIILNLCLHAASWTKRLMTKGTEPTAVKGNTFSFHCKKLSRNSFLSYSKPHDAMQFLSLASKKVLFACCCRKWPDIC
jgi:hypothetical protein